LAVVAVVIDLLRVLVLVYLWRRESADYLRLWTLGFILQSVGMLGMMPGLLGRVALALQALSLLACYSASVALLRGTARLQNRPQRWPWGAVAGVGFVVASVVRLVSGSMSLAVALPIGFLAFAYFTMGLALFRKRRAISGLGATLTILALVTSGLHFADFPFLAEVAWFVPWGIGIALFNEVALTVGLVVLHFDRTHAERELADARYAELADTIGVGTYEVTPEGRFSDVNGALARMLGYASTAEVLALDLAALSSSPAEPSLHSEALAGAEATWRRKDGQPLIVQLYGRALRDAEGQLRGYRGFVVDRTEAHGLEETLRRSQKLDAVGRLAGGVAHDFNNLLTIILSSLEMLSLKPGEKGPLRDAMEATDQAAQLTRRLLAFGSKHASRAEPVDVGATALRTVEMLGRSLGARHRVTTDGIGTGLWTRIDAGHLEQVVVNLVLNARDAMAEGGTIEVLIHRLSRAGQAGIELRVSDTGCGMTSEQQARIFEPFFSTKEPGRGTGLGLSTVHGIVSQAGGQIDVESAPGKGSRFALWLPECAPPEGARAPSTASPATTRRARVLVVDDEPVLRRSLCRMLEAAGHVTVEAASGNRALALLAAGEHFEVVVCDVRMPDGDGPSTAREFRARSPSTWIVLMSGFQDGGEGEARACSDVFLPKPFTREMLLRAVDSPHLRAAG
jgi:PAS domain S-box-containing protein